MLALYLLISNYYHLEHIVDVFLYLCSKCFAITLNHFHYSHQPYRWFIWKYKTQNVPAFFVSLREPNPYYFFFSCNEQQILCTSSQYTSGYGRCYLIGMCINCLLLNVGMWARMIYIWSFNNRCFAAVAISFVCIQKKLWI